DGALSTIVMNGTVRVLAGPVVHLASSVSGGTEGHPLPLVGTIEGGVGPYAYEFALSDQETAVGNVSRTGELYWNATPNVAGSLDARLRVTDALGNQVDASMTLSIAAVPPPTGLPPTSSSPTGPGLATSTSIGSWVLGLGGIAVAAGVYLFPRWRRRQGRERRGGSDSQALGAIRRILRGTDGLERETLYFLAEEEGLTQPAAASAIERWQRAGRVRIDVGLEGQDLIQWTESDTGGATDRDSGASDEDGGSE
ncbi:MAG: hypothetical protein L3K08_07405, partial [Thermoplasmata archaeon]|nr:hypothetical protein [Thermoplasmata archaeon]